MLYKKEWNRWRVFLISVLIALISILHYATPHARGIEHLIYRELYLVPLVLAAFWFGMKGGLVFSLVAAGFYLPLALRSSDQVTAYYVSNFTQVTIFIAFSLMVGWLRDRDLKLRAEQALNARMVAMGQAVASIAHDLKSPLMAVGGFVTQVRRTLGDQDPSARKLDIVIAQAARMETMVKDMLAFTRPLELNRQEVDLNHLIKEVVAVSEAAGDQPRYICTCLDSQLPTISLDNDRMQQAILNLVNNALEASPKNESPEVVSSLRNGKLRIEISDKGPGIPQEKQSQLFTPFVTTKKGGTGLGLPIAKKIIEAHGGILSLGETSTKGTTFIIDLPLTQSKL